MTGKQKQETIYSEEKQQNKQVKFQVGWTCGFCLKTTLVCDDDKINWILTCIFYASWRAIIATPPHAARRLLSIMSRRVTGDLRQCGPLPYQSPPSWRFVKTQLTHNQVEVGLTTLWVCNPLNTTHHYVKLCVIVVKLCSIISNITQRK